MSSASADFPSDDRVGRVSPKPEGSESARRLPKSPDRERSCPVEAWGEMTPFDERGCPDSEGRGLGMTLGAEFEEILRRIDPFFRKPVFRVGETVRE